jgi:uncharacterized protein YbaA (DUF1428 family)
MPKYVDGFVLVIPKDKVELYKKMAEMGRDSWMKNGALEYYECRGTDLKPQEMGGDQARSFTEITGAGSEDTVWFSFIVFNSKEHRDEVNAKVMVEMGSSNQEEYVNGSGFDIGAYESRFLETYKGENFSDKFDAFDREVKW